VDYATQGIRALSAGAKDFFASFPFVSAEGFNWMHLLHKDDIASYEGLCEHLSDSQERASAMGRGAPEPSPCTTKLRVLHFFQMPRHGGRGCQHCDGFTNSQKSALQWLYMYIYL
jgi:hypothetical protein